MTPQQEVALSFPCNDLDELLDQKYRKVYEIDGVLYSVLLTVEVDLEDPPVFGDAPIWHCSVAVIENRCPKPIFLWTEHEMNVVHGLIAKTVGIPYGDDAVDWTSGETALHFRRPVQPDECGCASLEPDRN